MITWKDNIPFVEQQWSLFCELEDCKGIVSVQDDIIVLTQDYGEGATYVRLFGTYDYVMGFIAGALDRHLNHIKSNSK